MADLVIKLVSQYGLAAMLGLASLVMQFWVASKLFTSLSDQNRALARLLERNGIDTEPPPNSERARRRGRLLPRAPTPLPFFPVAADERGPPPVPSERSRGRK